MKFFGQNKSPPEREGLVARIEMLLEGANLLLKQSFK